MFKVDWNGSLKELKIKFEELSLNVIDCAPFKIKKYFKNEAQISNKLLNQLKDKAISEGILFDKEKMTLQTINCNQIKIDMFIKKQIIPLIEQF